MRLSNTQKEIIEKTAIRHFGRNVKVYLFGSRVYSDQKGGDIDLFLEEVPEELIDIKNKIDFIVDLKRSLGDQKIDVVFKTSKVPQSKFHQSIEKSKVPIC
jgi:predicted nucleotidyltransferase